MVRLPGPWCAVSVAYDSAKKAIVFWLGRVDLVLMPQEHFLYSQVGMDWRSLWLIVLGLPTCDVLLECRGGGRELVVCLLRDLHGVLQSEW